MRRARRRRRGTPAVVVARNLLREDRVFGFLIPATFLPEEQVHAANSSAGFVNSRDGPSGAAPRRGLRGPASGQPPGPRPARLRRAGGPGQVEIEQVRTVNAHEAL